MLEASTGTAALGHRAVTDLPSSNVGAKVRPILRVGVPHREILAAARESSADLVVLGTHGRGETARLLVSSVADRVIRMATCPVFALREV